MLNQSPEDTVTPVLHVNSQKKQLFESWWQRTLHLTVPSLCWPVQTAEKAGQ